MNLPPVLELPPLEFDLASFETFYEYSEEEKEFRELTKREYYLSSCPLYRRANTYSAANTGFPDTDEPNNGGEYNLDKRMGFELSTEAGETKVRKLRKESSIFKYLNPCFNGIPNRGYKMLS
eukprot:TRINITY_DN5354_c0_g1_i12.p1 TRINITY_DN5354_c0_g1~~TRINITY_DN5354_c0_g1_i12.p1  ORF type:complete len:122 (-),score=5.40 TRINITY_DN5354_c0_g1_i12:125-490(-)